MTHLSRPLTQLYKFGHTNQSLWLCLCNSSLTPHRLILLTDSRNTKVYSKYLQEVMYLQIKYASLFECLFIKIYTYILTIDDGCYQIYLVICHIANVLCLAQPSLTFNQNHKANLTSYYHEHVLRLECTSLCDASISIPKTQIFYQGDLLQLYVVTRHLIYALQTI